MRTIVDEQKYPLNTVAPLFKRPVMLYKVHRLQGVKLGDRIALPGLLAYFINADITITEVMDRCHLPHGAFLRAWPMTNATPDYTARKHIKKWTRIIYDIDSDLFEYNLYRWDKASQQLVIDIDWSERGEILSNFKRDI